MLSKKIFVFIAVFVLAACAAFPVYEFNPEQDFTYLKFEVEGLKQGEDVPWGYMDLTVSRCLTDYMGEIDLAQGKATVKISTLQPFYGSFSVYYGDKNADRYLSFLPKEDRDYKLVYADNDDHYALKLFSSAKGANQFSRREPLLFGIDYFAQCSDTPRTTTPAASS
ncbi:hypothetical protein [Microbulbifer sp. SAOS-129_SWC]|uniref:hypothetical protein n=1 Tax=Microbulbifer sp. SAOS-129_SWC TaxID=3145235 RepID=UPI003217827C